MAHYLHLLAKPLVLVCSIIALTAGVMAQPSIVDERSAKNVARVYISDLGYKFSGRSFFSARIADSSLEDNVWHFKVRYGGSLPTYSGYVMVSALTGELIDSNVPNRCKVATSTNVISVGGC